MINDILRERGIHIAKAVTVYGTFYSVHNQTGSITNPFSDQNEAIITALLIVIADLSSDNNRLLKGLALHATEKDT